jgi:hypothetical protein
MLLSEIEKAYLPWIISVVDLGVSFALLIHLLFSAPLFFFGSFHCIDLVLRPPLCFLRYVAGLRCHTAPQVLPI